MNALHLTKSSSSFGDVRAVAEIRQRFILTLLVQADA
jgi:hypothetical protein